jgi:hypothetical protein
MVLIHLVVVALVDVVRLRVVHHEGDICAWRVTVELY